MSVYVYERITYKFLEVYYLVFYIMKRCKKVNNETFFIHLSL